MTKITDADKAAITAAVISAIDHYTDEPISAATSYANTGTIFLTRDLGIGPVMITALATPLNKISRQYGGQGLGIYDVQKANTVKDCIDIVITSIPGNTPAGQS